MKALVDIIDRFNPQAFYTVEDVKAVKEGVFRGGNRRSCFRQLVGLNKVK